MAMDVPDTSEVSALVPTLKVPTRGPGRPKGSKTKRVTVTEANLAQVLRNKLLEVATYLASLPAKNLAAIKNGQQWLEVIDGAFHTGVFPKKHQPGNVKRLTLNYNPQTLTIPPPIQAVQVSNPQHDALTIDAEGRGGCPPEGGNGPNAIGGGHLSEKFPEGEETDPDDSQEPDTSG